MWIARRIDIAEHWVKRFPYTAPDLVPSAMGREAFVEKFGSIFEHSPFIAERAWEYELGPANGHGAGATFCHAQPFPRCKFGGKAFRA